MTITVDRFLEGLKRRVTIPANDELLGDSGLLAIGDDVIRDKVLPLILSVNQNYFVTSTTIALVEDQSHYDIPYRAIGRTLRDLKLVSTDDETDVTSLSLVYLEDEHMFSQSGIPARFYFEGDQFVAVPVPNTTSYSFKAWYDLQHGTLTQVANAARVTSVAGAVVTCSSVPTSVITTSTPVDFVKGKAGCRTIGMDKTPTNVSATQITFSSSSSVPSTLVSGDYITLAQTSPVLQFPDEAHPLIETLAAARVCHAIGDFEAQGVLMKDSNEQEKAFLKLIAPRIQGENTKIVNRRGLLRGQGFSAGRVRRGFVV